jgi:hypothetical protein
MLDDAQIGTLKSQWSFSWIYRLRTKIFCLRCFRGMTGNSFHSSISSATKLSILFISARNQEASWCKGRIIYMSKYMYIYHRGNLHENNLPNTCFEEFFLKTFRRDDVMHMYELCPSWCDLAPTSPTVHDGTLLRWRGSYRLFTRSVFTRPRVPRVQYL